MSQRTIIADDLTGADLTGQDGTSRKISIDGANYSVDLSPESLAALTAFVSGEGSDKLFALAPSTGTGRTRRARSASGGSDGKSADMRNAREWGRSTDAGRKFATEAGIEIGQRKPSKRETDELVPAWVKAGKPVAPVAPAASVAPPAGKENTAKSA